ncbi:MAG: hypothetical protein K9I69_01010 [Ignavibacteriales bacterium]|nr:hypothetical protein [Ignavibacteriales bacterium]MCF8305827.1 hypothetical protein [Ignavibacteriales bacterium]MCF8315549.1 hypothetical protein [Ignavibacteriales bacterium]MCF8436921.1 hypothetical protein [Ignavibacteriales bacterium]
MRFKNAFLLFLCVFLLQEIYAQDGFVLSGYASGYSLAELPSGKNNTGMTNLGRVRIKPEYIFNRDIIFTSEYDLLLAFSKSENLFSAVSGNKNYRQAIDMTGHVFSNSSGAAIHSIDRLYLTYLGSLFKVTAGRQRIAWGSGRIWNPTDLFNPISPVNFTQIAKPGADAIKINCALGNFSDIELVYNYGETHNAAIRVRINYIGYDFILISGSFDNTPIGGFDITGDLLGAGIRLEGIYRFDKKREDSGYPSFILGADYQLTPDVYGLLEYFHNGGGDTDPADYDYASISSGRLTQPGKDYLAASLVYMLNPLLSSTITLLHNSWDKSSLIMPVIEYEWTQSFTISAGFLITNGTNESEFGSYDDLAYMNGIFWF